MTNETDNTNAAMLPGEKRATGIVAIVAMLRMFGLFALLPVLSLYAAGLENATPLLVGLAVGAYGLTQAGLQIPLGALSDRIGRVPVIVGGLAVFAAGSIIAALGDDIWSVIIGRLLQGAGAISATLTALIADATREQFRTRSMAFMGIGIGLSFMLALIIGPLLGAQFGVPALFWFAALLALLAGLLLRGLPEGIKPPKPQDWNLRPAFHADLLRLDFYVFLLHAILTASFVALPFLLAIRLEMPVTSHWQIYVGALLPLSEPGAPQAGQLILRGIELAAEYVNTELGGSLDGRPVEIVVGDDKGTPEVGATEYRRLVQDYGIVGATGCYHSSVGLATIEVAKELGAPVIMTQASNKAITESGYPQAFRTHLIDPVRAIAMVDFAKSQGYEKVAFIADTTDVRRRPSCRLHQEAVRALPA